MNRTTDAIRTEVARCLEQGLFDAAWAVVDRLDDGDPASARLWLDVARAIPGRPGVEARARRALERFADDPSVAIGACGALVAVAEQAASCDAPLLRKDGPAMVAAEAAGRVLARLGADARIDPEVAGVLWSLRANALRLAGASHDRDARAAFEAAIGLRPRDPDLRFDLGLLHKWRGRFEEALEATQQARSAGGAVRRDVEWNVAICATALGRAEVAVRAWHALGVPARPTMGGLPLVEGIPAAQVRVATAGAGYDADTEVPDRALCFELLEVAPLSPCHGVVQSPSFRAASVDYGDVVLWDGAPVAVDRSGPAPVPCFPLLAVLREGDELKLRFIALSETEEALSTLAEQMPADHHLIRQRSRVQRGASGEPRAVEPLTHRVWYGKLVLPAEADLGRVAETLQQFSRRDGRCAIAVPELYERLGDTERAGREHQAWRGIEKSGRRALALGGR